MSTTPLLTDLAGRLWEARSMRDVADVMAMAEKRYGPIEKRPVGGRENNIGIIRLASDPGLASVERITNGMDAVLELQALLKDQSAASPRAAWAACSFSPSCQGNLQAHEYMTSIPPGCYCRC